MENIDKFKTKLLEEKSKLEAELKSIGRINPENPGDWEAVETNTEVPPADKNEAADAIEEFEENTAILRELEIQYQNVLSALGKIESGTYGICEVGGESIAIERLEANPTATTCVEHSKSSTS